MVMNWVCLPLQVMMLIQNHPVPVIAMVNGLATAAGCQLVASCDIAVASDKSSFATPGVNIGLFCSTPGVALARAMPRKVIWPPAAPLSNCNPAVHVRVSSRIRLLKVAFESGRSAPSTAGWVCCSFPSDVLRGARSMQLLTKRFTLWIVHFTFACPSVWAS